MFLLSTLTVKGWASEEVKKYHQAFEEKNHRAVQVTHLTRTTSQVRA